MSIQEIEDVLAELPDEQLDDLIGRLAQRRGMMGPRDYDPEWLAELDRRIDDIEAGAPGIPAEEVFARMKARRDTVRFHDRAEAETQAAHDYYAERTPSRGAEFEAELWQLIQTIQRYPESGSPLIRGGR